MASYQFEVSRSGVQSNTIHVQPGDEVNFVQSGRDAPTLVWVRRDNLGNPAWLFGSEVIEVPTRIPMVVESQGGLPGTYRIFVDQTGPSDKTSGTIEVGSGSG
jgi:hypothetical protein